MTKLEEKLKELGYERNREVIEPNPYIFHYLKWVNEYFFIGIKYDTKINKIDGVITSWIMYARTQEKKKQQAFNVMEKDLKELNKCQHIEK